ncbi:hypothetical protein VTI74DRAFT_613 [Chaetomium olivicolor]
MADPLAPLAITTAIITLSRAFSQVIGILQDFANAERSIGEIRRDCVLTKNVLQFLEEQLQRRRELPPTIPPGSNTSASISLINVLNDNVVQLQSDVEVFLRELQSLSRPCRPNTRFGRFLERGQVAWNLSNLEAMRQRIVMKRMQLEVIARTLNDYIPPPPTPRRRSDESGGFPVFPGWPLDFETQRQIIRAVWSANHRDLETLLQNASPNFYVKICGRDLTPLHVAAMRGKLDVVDILISHGARVNSRGGNQDTALTLAISHRHPDVALTLICQGANVLLADEQERTPLHIAAEQNMYALVEVLLNHGAVANAADRKIRTPLMAAIERVDREVQPDDTNILRALLRRNQRGEAGDPTIGTLEGRHTPLHEAAARGYIKDLEVMLTAEAWPNLGADLVLDSEGRTPLWHAARKGHVDAVELLLQHGAGAHINHLTRDPDYPTVLWAMSAAKVPNVLNGVSTLLGAGASPNTPKPTSGRTLLHRACITGNLSLLTVLLRHNADLRIPDSEGMQPLHYAARKGHALILTALLQYPPFPLDINTPTTTQGLTPLMLAAESGHDFLLHLLLHTHGASVDHTNAAGCDALYLACESGHVLCAALLLGAGADINRQNAKGNTALHIAARMGEVEMVAWLLRMGADGTKRSRAAFEGLGDGVVGTPAEVARGVREVVRSRCEEERVRVMDEVVGLLEGWEEEEMRRRRKVRWVVRRGER